MNCGASGTFESDDMQSSCKIVKLTIIAVYCHQKVLENISDKMLVAQQLLQNIVTPLRYVAIA